MDWIEKINWELLAEPHELLVPFKPSNPDDPTDPFYMKVSRLQNLLLKKPLWLSDEYRTEDAIQAITYRYFNDFACNVFYEVGDFQALIGLTDIIPGYKCDLTFKLVDPKVWGADFVRAARDLFDLYINEFRLKRISTESPDERIVRMANMVGFKYEGERDNAFRWNGKFYPLTLLGKYGEK